MNKVHISILLISFFFISFATAACTDTNEIDISDIPCEGITDPINCGGNISVLNLNVSGSQTNVTTSGVGGGMLNFTVNFTEGSYQLTDCANNTATIIIGDFPRDDLWRTAIMIGFIGIAFVIIIMARISFDKKGWMIKMLMYLFGSLIILVAIQTGLIFARVANIKTMMTSALVISITSISIFFMYILIFYTIELIKSVKESKRIKEEET